MALPSASKTSVNTFNKGEQPIDNAPFIEVNDNLSCVPQHYLTYSHDRETIEALLAQIDFDERYLLFVDEDGDVPYIQVGIVGYDNYKSEKAQLGKKIVFGRKWRVEPNLPTSEIIQTTFLALKKAAEHELRERLTFITQSSKGRKVKTTPFNGHHDIPLFVRCQDDLRQPLSQQSSLEDIISRVKFNKGQFIPVHVEQRHSSQWIIDLDYRGPSEYGLKSGDTITLLLPDICENTVVHTLMEALIRRSDRLVDEQFKFQGFAVFSRTNSISAISALSSTIRGKKSGANCMNAYFDRNLEKEKYDTDSSRVPKLTQSAYSNSLREQLQKLDIRVGFCPK